MTITIPVPRKLHFWFNKHQGMFSTFGCIQVCAPRWRPWNNRLITCYLPHEGQTRRLERLLYPHEADSTLAYLYAMVEDGMIESPHELEDEFLKVTDFFAGGEHRHRGRLSRGQYIVAFTVGLLVALLGGVGLSLGTYLALYNPSLPVLARVGSLFLLLAIQALFAFYLGPASSHLTAKLLERRSPRI